ncbi:MAG: hypothetical protein QOI80_1569 [Solirubrobacteraceae bacterium]|jgi:hypothetical protein|nr:hypothetical protein [Solirubrobacteraceae bacterium]
MRAVRRWLLRLLALLALGGVTYGVITIVKEGTKDDGPTRSSIQPALEDLAASQEALAVRLESLRPRHTAPKLLPAIRAVRRDREAVLKEVRRRQEKRQAIPDKRKLDDALAAEFDYLDALGSVTRNRRSPLIRSVDDRAQTAKDAFIDLPDSAGVEDGIRGTQSFLAWARARR